MSWDIGHVNLEAISQGVGKLRQPGAILLIACYELGHQPLGVASPLGSLEQAGYAPAALDIAVERLDAAKVARARFIGIAVPMHTALRLGVRLVERIRGLNPSCHICCYGLYATLNAEYLLAHGVNSVIGGEYEAPFLALIRSLDAERGGAVIGVSRCDSPAGPFLQRIEFPVPSRRTLPPLKIYAHLERDGARSQVGYVEASRGCKHHCLHCPIPPVYGGRFFAVPQEVVLEDVRQLVQSVFPCCV